MKYIFYTLGALVAGALFLPHRGSEGLRNLPLLLFLLFLLLLWGLIRLLKYAVLLARTKRILRQSGAEILRVRYFPWSAWLGGHYSILVQMEGKRIQFLLLSKKRRALRYHFDSTTRLELYRSNHVVFQSIKTKGAIISKQVETNRVGKQHLKWDASADLGVVLFDQLPEQVTDSAKREALGAKDPICASRVYLLDFAGLCKHLKENFQ